MNEKKENEGGERERGMGNWRKVPEKGREKVRGMMREER